MLSRDLPKLICVLFAALFIGATIGCQSGFRASKLPSGLQAPPARSAQQIDLSHLARATSQNDVIYVSDVLQVSIATGLESYRFPTWMLRVSEKGTVNVPLVGPVRVAGMEFTEAERAIHNASVERGIYRNPQVSVLIKQRRSNRITVVGAVNKPGPVELPTNGSDLLSAIVAANGLAKDADTIVEVRHPASANQGSGFATQASFSPDEQMRSQQVDLTAAHIADGRDYRLEDGAVVMVRQRPARTIHVMGLVRRAGQFKMPDDQDLRLLDAIALASGLTTELANKVRIVRQVSGQSEAVTINASINAAKVDNDENVRLAPGDVVTVEQTAALFAWLELQKFVRFAFTATSRLTILP